MPKFSHFILTVFNVRVAYGGGKSPDRAWLDHRFHLFDTFCYPAVKSQTVQDFTWLVFFDASTPDEYRGRIEEYGRWDCFVPIFVDQIMSIESFARMKNYLIGDRAGSPEILITTQLDNDDALHRRYIEHVQGEVGEAKREFINASNGYVLDLSHDRLYRKRDVSNPFISLIEPYRDFLTVWCGPHPKLSSFGPIRQLETAPLWLQVVHGRNKYNNIGIRRRLPLSLLREEFVVKYPPDDVRESTAGILLENMFHGFQLVPEKIGLRRRA